ncbi:MAG TPA: ABC transporter permease [Anaerolineaceae bacterium]|jgi:simple sugar transport system permease protein
MSENHVLEPPETSGAGASPQPEALPGKRRYGYRFEKREIGFWLQNLSILVAILAALLVSAGLIMTSGADVAGALLALFKGAFGTLGACLETLVQATPILFTGLAMVIAFRGKVWNIGGEGQFFAGALAAAWVCLNFYRLPQTALIVTIVLASLLAGALWAFIPGILKARFGISEIVVTVMANYIMTGFVAYLLSGPWQAPNDHFLETARFKASTYLPTFFNSRIHLGFWIAIILVAAAYVLLWKTPLGYEIRAVGENPVAAKYKGIRDRAIILIVMCLSGGIAGIAGGMELAGLNHRLRLDISNGYGYTGILIALLGRLNPIGVIPAAIFFGALINGSTSMQITFNVPVPLVTTIQGVVLIFLLIFDTLFRYRIRRVAL